MRNDSRENNQLRDIKITKNFIKYAEGSVLIEFGNTKVITAVNRQMSVPSFLNSEEQGWLTAEYSLLPFSTESRVPREASKGKIKGRTHEIQRLIGRSLRACLDMSKIPGISLWIDCDVIQADGGTRTASITGSYVALRLAINKMLNDGIIVDDPIISQIGAISVGIVNGEVLLDLNYQEDSNADVDMNIVMNNKNEFIEIQGTSESNPFAKPELLSMIDYAGKGIKEIFKIQNEVLGE